MRTKEEIRKAVENLEHKAEEIKARIERIQSLEKGSMSVTHALVQGHESLERVEAKIAQGKALLKEFEEAEGKLI